jgi:hypothetical protein
MQLSKVQVRPHCRYGHGMGLGPGLNRAFGLPGSQRPVYPCKHAGFGYSYGYASGNGRGDGHRYGYGSGYGMGAGYG